MATNIGTLALFMTGNTTGLFAAFNRAEQRAVRFASNVSGSLAAAGVGMGILAVAAGALFTGASLKQAISFEAAFVGVEKTVNGTTEEMLALSEAIQEMSTQIPVGANELANIGKVAGQLGVRGNENLEKFIETIARIGVSTDLAMEEAAFGFARFSEIMDFPISKVDFLASAVVDLGNKFAATESEILDISTRIAAAANLIGVTADEVLALSVTLRAIGIPAERGGTAIQRAFIEINQSVVEAEENLNTIARVAGMSSEAFAKLWEQDANKAFERFVLGLQESGDEATLLLDDLDLASQRNMQTLLGLAQNTDVWRKAQRDAASAIKNNNALMTESERVFASTQAQLSLFGNNIVQVMRDFGTRLLPSVNQALVGISNWFDSNGPKLVSMWDAALPFVEAYGTGLKFIFDSLTRVLGKAAEFLSWADDATSKFDNVKKVMVAIGAAIAFGPGSVIVGIGLVIENFDKLQIHALETAARIAEGFFNLASQIAKAFGEVIDQVINPFIDGIQASVDAINFLNPFGETIGRPSNINLSNTLEETFAAMGDDAAAALNAFADPARQREKFRNAIFTGEGVDPVAEAAALSARFADEFVRIVKVTPGPDDGDGDGSGGALSVAQRLTQKRLQDITRIFIEMGDTGVVKLKDLFLATDAAFFSMEERARQLGITLSDDVRLMFEDIAFNGVSALQLLLEAEEKLAEIREEQARKAQEFAAQQGRNVQGIAGLNPLIDAASVSQDINRDMLAIAKAQADAGNPAFFNLLGGGTGAAGAFGAIDASNGQLTFDAATLQEMTVQEIQSIGDLAKVDLINNNGPVTMHIEGDVHNHFDQG